MSAPGRPLPFAPHGAVDGFVCDSEMAKDMTICGRYGSSCGTAFIKDEFIKKNRQYENFASYLKDRPSEEWTNLSAEGDEENEKENEKENDDENSHIRSQDGGRNKPKFRLTRKSKNYKKRTLKSHK